jgi:CheY-like chemotaxis protein
VADVRELSPQTEWFLTCHISDDTFSQHLVLMSPTEIERQQQVSISDLDAMKSSKHLCDNSDIKDSFVDQSATKPHHILIAEDNEVNRALAQDILEFLGFAVHAVENGELALKIALQQTFDLILMDCQMPVVDGFEATRRIRTVETEAGHSKTPIVALSGHPNEEGRGHCLAAGMDDYLQKPFTINELQEMIAKWLPVPA